MAPKEANESTEKSPNEITEIERLVDANVQLTKNMNYLAVEVDTLKQYRQKYNDLLSTFNDMAAAQKGAFEYKTDANPNTVDELLERIKRERVMHVQQMEKCCEQNQIQIDEVRKQMSDKMQDLMQALYEHQDEMIRAKEMTRKITGENHHIRQKIQSKNWEIVNLQRKLSFCSANIGELNAAVQDCKRREAKYKTQIQYLKQGRANQSKQYPFAMANNEMAQAKMHKRRYTANDGVDCSLACKRVLLRKAQHSSNK